MTEAGRSATQRTRRLREIARELGVPKEDDLSLLSPPIHVPTFRERDDERKADIAIENLRIQEAAAQPQAKGLKRAFTSNKKIQAPPTYKELYGALVDVVGGNGPAGVVEVLFSRFRKLNGDINLSRRASTNVFKKIGTYSDAQEQRGQLLQIAAANGRLDLVQLLSRFGDQTSLDESLKLALGKRELSIIETLLSHGANAAIFTPTFQNAASHGDHEVLKLLLRAPKGLPLRCFTQSLLPATASGSVESVALLAQAGADGEYDNASALMHAITVGRRDLVVAIVLGSSPPSPVSLNQGIGFLFSSAIANLSHCRQMLEILLCGGPNGNAACEGLFSATTLAKADIMKLLLEYNVDINYNGAYAVGHAIQKCRVDLVGLLLQNQKLRPELASESVRCIPPTSPPQVKVPILSMLLLQGAFGDRCNEQLVVAVELNDFDTAQLLLRHDGDRSQRPCVVSVDYNAGQCLQIAVSRGNIPMAELLVKEGSPSKFSLCKAFPLIPTVNEETRFLMTKILVDAGAKGPELDAALLSVTTSNQQSGRLVDLLVTAGANVNGQTLLTTVSRGNAELLNILLKGNPSVATSTAAIPLAMKLQDSAKRFYIIKVLLPYATASGIGGNEIAKSLIDVLRNFPKEMKLIRLLCEEGKANINFHDGQAVIMALQFADPTILDIVLQSGGGPPEPQTIGNALLPALELPLTDAHRHRKVESLLRRAKPQEALDSALIQEIRSALSVKRDLSVIQTLLTAGADVNCSDSAPICFAVRDPAIMDLILLRRPTHKSLSMAFPLAVALHNPERYSLCEKLLRAGARGDEISKALLVAAKEGISALPFMKLLLPQADVNFKEGRVLRLVVQRVFREGLDLLVSQRSHMPSMATKRHAFHEAMNIRNNEDRFDMVKKLLEAGIKGEIVSDALLTAVDSSDVRLTELLLRFGASVEHKAGKAVHVAASSGNGEILKRLVGGTISPKPTLSTLTTGFEGAISSKEKGKGPYEILEILLSAGMRGEAVDVALVDSVTGGDPNIALIELLYSYGASIEWDEGEALDIATRLGFIETLVVLLGSHVSQNVLKRVYRSSLSLSGNQRSNVVQLILRAGKSIDTDVMSTLLQATKESPADRQLIRILLEFDVFDEGQSMVHAGGVLDLETLTILIGSPKASVFISSAFRNIIATETIWQSDRGISIMRLMLERGVTGEAVAEALVTAVQMSGNSSNVHMSEFVELFLRFNADVNYQRGLALQCACKYGNIDLVRKLLPKAASDAKSMAFPYLFASLTDETSIIQLIEIFTEDSDERESLDIDFRHPDSDVEPILFIILNNFPRKTQVLKFLLEVGFNPNQWQLLEYDPSTGHEPITVLCWALSQPQKKISSANINLLIEYGANVNFVSKSQITPVMLSIENRRPDILERLISKGAKVTVPDRNGVTPLARASQLGSSDVMGHLLNADAEIDDGSLHDAARELRCDAMRVLIKHSHDVDYPSDRHGGRSPLAELCLKAAENAARSELEEAITCLVSHGADIRISCMGKSIFHYALDSLNPPSILPVLLKVLWRNINDDCYLYTDGRYTYSLTKYVEKGLLLGPRVHQEEIINHLKMKRAVDRFWANSIFDPQPQDICGAPMDIMQEVNHQRIRDKRRSEQVEDAEKGLELRKKVFEEESKIRQAETDGDIRRDREKARADESIVDDRADQNLRIMRGLEMERQRLLEQKQTMELNHTKATGIAQVAIQQELGRAKIEHDRAEHTCLLEFTEEKIRVENQGVQKRLAIEGSAFQEREKQQTRAHERDMARLKSQKALVESNASLASQLRAGGATQRQIGYVLGEE